MKREMRFGIIVLAAIATITLARPSIVKSQENASAPAGQQAQAPAAKSIFDYQQELNLTDKQVESLKKSMADFRTQMSDFQQKMAALRQDLTAAIRDKAPIKDIRKKAEKIGSLQVDATMADIETSRKIEELLTPDQLNKWKVIQEKFRQEFQEKVKAAQEAQKAAK
ncbi:MAG: Spy/CpxP family protein refolding chaperone [Candidatus Omnitrophica bacterium]|nr:Spy/CpxP family protein refolding chaperone [Candidatus Omnitrophota bacterium]